MYELCVHKSETHREDHYRHRQKLAAVQYHRITGGGYIVGSNCVRMRNVPSDSYNTAQRLQFTTSYHRTQGKVTLWGVAACVCETHHLTATIRHSGLNSLFHTIVFKRYLRDEILTLQQKTKIVIPRVSGVQLDVTSHWHQNSVCYSCNLSFWYLYIRRMLIPALGFIQTYRMLPTYGTSFLQQRPRCHSGFYYLVMNIYCRV